MKKYIPEKDIIKDDLFINKTHHHSIIYFRTRIPNKTGKVFKYSSEKILIDFAIKYLKRLPYENNFGANLHFEEIYDIYSYLQLNIRIYDQKNQREIINIDSYNFEKKLKGKKIYEIGKREFKENTPEGYEYQTNKNFAAKYENGNIIISDKFFTMPSYAKKQLLIKIYIHEEGNDIACKFFQRHKKILLTFLEPYKVSKYAYDIEGIPQNPEKIISNLYMDIMIKRKINNNLKPLCKFIKKNINEHINKNFNEILEKSNKEKKDKRYYIVKDGIDIKKINKKKNKIKKNKEKLLKTKQKENNYSSIENNSFFSIYNSNINKSKIPSYSYCYTATSDGTDISLLKIEINASKGNGRLEITGDTNNEIEENIIDIYNCLKYLKTDNDFILKGQHLLRKSFINIKINNLLNYNLYGGIGSAVYVAILSSIYKLNIENELSILGNISIEGKIEKVPNFIEIIKILLENGKYFILAPMDNKDDFFSINSITLNKFNITFYHDTNILLQKAFIHTSQDVKEKLYISENKVDETHNIKITQQINKEKPIKTESFKKHNSLKELEKEISYYNLVIDNQETLKYKINKHQTEKSEYTDKNILLQNVYLNTQKDIEKETGRSDKNIINSPKGIKNKQLTNIKSIKFDTLKKEITLKDLKDLKASYNLVLNDIEVLRWKIEKLEIAKKEYPEQTEEIQTQIDKIQKRIKIREDEKENNKIINDSVILKT